MANLTEQQQRDMNHIQKHVAALREHFDTVQIFVTRYEGRSVGTTNVYCGSGNWFARFGQVRLWADEQKNADSNDSDGFDFD